MLLTGAGVRTLSVNRWLCSLVLCGLALSLSGCPAKVEGPGPAPSVTPETTEPAVEADDAAAVTALEEAGVKLTKNAAGNVTAADCRTATVDDDVVKNFAGLHSLTSLSLENGQITDEGLAVLKDLPQLTSLNLRRCTNVTVAGLVHLEHLTNLQRLYLLYTRTTDAGLAPVAKLPQLRVLDLRGCNEITDKGIETIAPLVNLADLKLRSYLVTDKAMVQIGKFTKLRVLSMEDCGIGNEGMQHLSGLTEMRSLNVMRTLVGDKGLEACAGMTVWNLRRDEGDGHDQFVISG